MTNETTIIRFNLLPLKAKLEIAKGKAYKWGDIARVAGLHSNTLYDIVNNKNRRVDLVTLEKLLDFFRAEGLPIEIGELFAVSLSNEYPAI
ncbi:MAG: helix-turn-helix transcriptional regulator [Ardenticatenales bacterium]|nr:helix-turn-helix transcriptional regulator [Ardenticatenales bacterium]